MLRRQRLGGGRVEALDDVSLARDFSVAAVWYSTMFTLVSDSQPRLSCHHATEAVAHDSEG